LGHGGSCFLSESGGWEFVFGVGELRVGRLLTEIGAWEFKVVGCNPKPRRGGLFIGSRKIYHLSFCFSAARGGSGLDAPDPEQAQIAGSASRAKPRR